MKRPSSFSSFCALAICLSFPSIAVAQNAQNASFDKQTFALFEDYPNTPEVRAIAYSHSIRWDPKTSKLLLYATWFLRGDPRVAMETMVYVPGSVHTRESIYDWADRDVRVTQLSEQAMLLLTTTLDSLPAAKEKPPVAYALIVTGKLEGKYQTRIYDRREMPAQLRKVYEIVHSTVDSK